jgi:hypothetical protein
MEIVLNNYKNLEKDLYNFEKELNSFGIQLIHNKAINRVSIFEKVEITIEIVSRKQAKLVHQLACKYFGKAYVFLSLAA